MNTFVYDGLDQLVSEVRTGPVAFSHGYTYDHNGNPLTQTVNGALVQQFSYDAHDKLTGGLNESEGYDANGNLQTQTVGGQTTTFTWDDEDRLVSQQFPDGHTDGYSYTGLGMRLTKGDPTGSYSYLADGVAPASDVLSDGHTTFTPGLSEYNALGSRFYLGDAQGNSRGLLDGGQNATDGYNWDAFGNLASRFGSNPTAFAWNGAAGYQSDGDSGLKLLGHRYYDSRTGRFISQDPGKDGHNWYAYCGNDPMNRADPSGLWCPTPGNLSTNGGTQSDGGWATGQSGMMEARADQFMAFANAYCQISVLLASVSGQAFTSKDDAAKAALRSIYKKSSDETWEYNGAITKGTDGKYHVTGPFKSQNPNGGSTNLAGDTVGMYHTHPPEVSGQEEVFPEDFSPGDYQNANRLVHTYPGFQSYIETPTAIRRYSPDPNAPANSSDEHGPIKSWLP